MPGTVLVSVLELLGLPFPSPSSLLIKISMGKKEYQTWDKGDFSFPLTTLRETLFVIVQDAEGNEISRGGIESKSIVERGLWDDIFPLEGGGQVRMKLQFVLNQDEKNRIRMMRESAIKRKQSGTIDRRTSTVEVLDKNEESTSSAIPSPQIVDTQPSSIRPQELVVIPWPQSVTNQPSKSHSQESVAVLPPQRFDNQPSKAHSEESVAIPSPQRFDNQPSKARSQELVAIPSPQRFDNQASKTLSQEPVAILSPQRFNNQPSKARSQESVTIPPHPSEARSQESVASPSLQGFDNQPSKTLPQEPISILSPQRFDNQPSKARSQESVTIPSPRRFDTQPSKAHAQSVANEIPSNPFQTQQLLPGIRSSESRVSSSKKRPSLERSPSSVKRMISAFENNVPQDIRPEIMPRLEKQQVNKLGLESKQTKTESSKTMQSTRKLEELSTTKVREKGIDVSSNGQLKLVPKRVYKKETKPVEEFIETPMVGTSLASDKKPFEYRQQINNVVSNFNRDDDDDDSVFEESQSSQSSTIGRNSTDCHEDIMGDWFEISGAWIFPDQQRVFCVTTGGKKVMDLMENLGINSVSHQKNSGGTSKPKTKDVESSSGLFGQIVKVAIMVGFGVLVIFTRQRTNR